MKGEARQKLNRRIICFRTYLSLRRHLNHIQLLRVRDINSRISQLVQHQDNISNQETQGMRQQAEIILSTSFEHIIVKV